MKLRLCIWVILALCCGHLSARETFPLIYTMNTGWAFFRGDVKEGYKPTLDVSSWMPASLPHIMQLERKHCGGDVIYDGVGWYRRKFTAPESFQGKRVAVSFEGVMNACTVYLNGDSLYHHRGGYVGFTVDLSKHLKFGAENVLALRVSAEYDPLTPPGKPQDRLDFYYYSGIYRDVTLHVTDRLHISDALEEDLVAGGGIFVTYPKVSAERSVVSVRSHLKNDGPTARAGQYELILKDARGRAVARKLQDFSIPAYGQKELPLEIPVEKPHLWFPDSPYLYTLECRVKEGKQVIDRRTEQIGIRSIRYSTEDGFFINGKPLYLVGANRHQAYPYVGDAASNSMQVREVIDMKRGGYNAVRAAHYPNDPAFLDACDRYGLLVVECIPGWQYFNDNPVFADRLESICRRMIRRDRNHPSIILWETALNETSYPMEVVRRISEAAHSEYPGNQFYTAGDYFSHEDTEPYYDVFYKQVSRFPKDGNVLSNFLEDQIAVKPLLTREWGDGVGEKPRVSIREDEWEQLKQCDTRMKHLNGEGYFDWCMLDANPRMAGRFMWSYNDYNRGAEEETMFSGVVDVNRWPKFGYYLMQSQRPLVTEQDGQFGGPMVFIASFNSSDRYASSTKQITVFSNCDEVRLFRNGKLIGKQTRAERTPLYPHVVQKGGSPMFVFDAGGYEAGNLHAEGYVAGKKVAQHDVHTPGAPHHIEIYVPEYPIVPLADGSDQIPVYFKVCDEKGTLVSQSDMEINISVSGEGTLIGGGIGRLGISRQQVEGGVGFALIRTTAKAGKIQIQVEAEGLQSGTCTLRTVRPEAKALPGGYGAELQGKEEDGVKIKANKEERAILARKQIKPKKVTVTSEHADYPVGHLTDGDDFSWWIADTDVFPQTITLELEKPVTIYASRIRFQKDSSSYLHKVEYSEDGTSWHLAYERECTGWDFKPVKMEKTARFLRITVEKVSEGRAGLAEITLFE